MTTSLSIIVPAYNEEQRIGTSLAKIDHYFDQRGISFEILVVDDGSIDSTVDVVSRLAAAHPRLKLIRSERNRGKGHAIRAGVIASIGERILVSDADLSTPIEEFETLKLPLDCDQADIAIGSRALELSRIIKRQPWWRQGMGKMFNRLVRMLVLEGIKDTQCGFKLFTGAIAREIFAHAVVDRFAYDVEILALANKEGYRIAEIPVSWKNAPGSKVNPVSDSLRMMRDLLIIRKRLGKQSLS